jgi:hypothetical protein
MKDSVGRSVAAVRQIQAQYNATEDRIMLRIGTKDAENAEVPGIWITRRYLSLLCKALQQFFNADPDISGLVTSSDREEVKAFKAQQILAQAEFNAPFKDQPAAAQPDYPLAFKLTYQIVKRQLHLSLIPQVGAGLNLVLSHEVAVSLNAILTSAAVRADWQLVSPASKSSKDGSKIIN